MNKRVLKYLILCFLLVSCSFQPMPKESSFSPTQNGFGVMVKWIGIDSGPEAKLLYKGTNDIPVLVWPFIGTHGYPILYTNDVALLLADKPDEKGRFGNGVLILTRESDLRWTFQTIF